MTLTKFIEFEQTSFFFLLLPHLRTLFSAPISFSALNFDQETSFRREMERNVRADFLDIFIWCGWEKANRGRKGRGNEVATWVEGMEREREREMEIEVKRARRRKSDPDERVLSWVNIHPNIRPENCVSHCEETCISLSSNVPSMQMNVKIGQRDDWWIVWKTARGMNVERERGYQRPDNTQFEWSFLQRGCFDPQLSCTVQSKVFVNRHL